MLSPYRQNAFFLLDARADATTQEIRRLQNRAEVLLEMRKSLEATVLPFLRRAQVTREDILSGVQKLEDGQSRIREELQWLHAGPKGDCMPSGPSSLASLTTLLRTLAKTNGRQGAIATHNLAVLSHALAFEQESGGGASVQSRLDAWAGALSLWRALYQKEEFWDFMSERISAWGDPTVSDGDLQHVRREFAEQLLAPNRQLAAEYFASGAYDFARIHLQIIHSASTWISPGKRLLAELSTEMVRRTRTQLDESLLTIREDVLSSLDTVQKKERLARSEKEILTVGNRVIANLTLFEEMHESNEVLGDQIGQCLRVISIRYFNQLDDSQNALRLADEAFRYARTGSCKAQIVLDRKTIAYRSLRDRAIEFANQLQYGKAAERLEEARAIVPEDEKGQLEELLATCRRNEILDGVDTKKNSPTLSTINGIGATFYGKRDYHKASDSYVTTHFFTFLFFPVIPLGAYRVVSTGTNTYRIFGKVALSKLTIWYRRLVLAAVGLFFVYSAIESNNGTSSPGSFTPTRTDAPSSYSTPPITPEPTIQYSQSRTEKSDIDRERQELDARENQLSQTRQELKTLKAQIDSLEREIEAIKQEYPGGELPHTAYVDYQDKVSRHDVVVDKYNPLLEDFKSRAQQYDQDVVQFNNRVRDYNSHR